MQTNWETCQISDLCKIEYGKALKNENRNKGEYPVYGSNGIVGYHDKACVDNNSVVIGRKGSIGEVHYSDIPFWPIDTTYYLDYDSTKVNIKWLYRLLKTLKLKQLNRSAAIPGLNRNDVYRIKVLLPPLDDQIRIATVLTRAEKLITKRKETIKALDELLKSTFLEMFGDPVRNEKGWDIVTINDFCKRVVDCPHSTPEYSSTKTGLYCIRSSDVQGGYLNLNETLQVNINTFNDRNKRYIPSYNDIVFTREGGRLGNAAKVPQNISVCLGQRIMLFIINKTSIRCFCLFTKRKI